MMTKINGERNVYVNIAWALNENKNIFLDLRNNQVVR